MKQNKIQTPRLYELDLLKAVAIIAMIFCHCTIRLGQHWPGFEQDVRYLIGERSYGYKRHHAVGRLCHPLRGHLSGLLAD